MLAAEKDLTVGQFFGVGQTLSDVFYVTLQLRHVLGCGCDGAGKDGCDGAGRDGCDGAGVRSSKRLSSYPILIA